MNKDIARDISYASSAKTRSGRTVIRLLEGVTGRGRLIRKAAGYEQEVRQGADFWQVMMQRYNVDLRVHGAIDALPRTGPLVLVANHPYGILDGLVMGHLLAAHRGDFRILANSVFNRADDINRIILPISFSQTKEAVRTNLETRKKALAYLNDGGAIGVFPGGTVSTAARPFTRPMDPSWRNFTAKMIQKSGATVVPVYFHGNNSRLFQLASHVHETLRLGLLISEFRARLRTPLDVTIGKPCTPTKLAEYGRDSAAMMRFLRQATYELSPTPLNTLDYGYEFEEKYRA
ncbi:lysophospholipid acyltransferase family protein [Falsihalocynthiibacter sp. SS001]|uniref:lysophospholipid acyltransferase family protein n=1 Tax=Falsihalocynthiibacter sp. SS001 TaxID=3349698 RepID=UPI0036D41A64